MFGSLPPEGRDVDALVQVPDQPKIAAALQRAGFVRSGSAFVRFADCTAEAVELVSATEWDLPGGELAALYDEAIPLSGAEFLVRPAPHHALLILARRIAAGDGRLDGKRRARVHEALRENPRALVEARRRAPAWAAERALDGLEKAMLGGTMSARERARAMASRRAAAGAGPLLASLSGWRRQLPRRRARGAVIAISGLDGAGKSSQAQYLATALRQLGVEATVSWSRFAWDDALARFSVPLKRAIAVPAALALSLRGGSPGVGKAVDGRSAAAGASRAVADPVRTLRERSLLLTQAWTCVIAAFNVLDHNRLLLPRLRRGEVVICDRYTLDSVVALRFDYGPTRRFRLQRWLIATLSPTPRSAFFLDVSPATARDRKPEHSVEWLTGHAMLYRQEFQSLGVVRLDGERPRAELCTEIGTHVWSALR